MRSISVIWKRSVKDRTDRDQKEEMAGVDQGAGASVKHKGCGTFPPGGSSIVKDCMR